VPTQSEMGLKEKTVDNFFDDRYHSKLAIDIGSLPASSCLQLFLLTFSISLYFGSHLMSYIIIY
jgi:hypothetical protein